MTHSAIALAAFLLVSSTLAQAAEVTSVFSTNANWRMFRGRTEASSPVTAWRTVSFDDSAFTNTPAPFTYGEGYTYGTVLTDMLNQYTCLFLRRTFQITNVANVAALRLGAKVDDGFVVWVNGVELERVNMPEPAGSPITITNLSSGAPAEPVPFESYIRGASPYLVNGTNVIAVQVFNVNLPSTDLVFDCSLDAILVDTAPPTIVSVTPAPGPVTNLTQITVQFSEPVSGVTPDDLIINTLAASSVTGTNATYTFTFAQPAYGSVSISWATNHGIVDLAIPPNGFDRASPGANWQYTFTDVVPPTVIDLRPAASTTVRTLGEVRVTFSEDVNGVNASDLRLNGIAATNVIADPGAVYRFQFAPAGPGNVQASWASGHGITDLATSPNAFVGGTWSYVVDPNLQLADVVINEILAANVTGLSDPIASGDTDPLPWIELHNRSTSTIDLAGWSLSDDPEFPGRWVFPAKTIGPNQYLIVFASGLNITNATGTNRLHTDFRLSRGGEFLGLYSPDSPPALVSSFSPNYPEQRNDYSYGRTTTDTLRYFATPTPGAPNGNSTIIGVAEPVHFSTERGHFTQPFELVLSSPTRGTQIRYTVNGTEPTLNGGLLYVSPLRITNTALIRAVAFRPDMLPSITRTHTYFFNLSPAQRSLPVLSIVTAVSNLTGRSGIIGMGGGSRAGDNLFITNNPATDFHNPSAHGIAWERPVSLELIRPEDNSGFQIDCGLRVQGSDYQRPRLLPTSKFSFRAYFRGDYGPGRLEYEMFPLATSRSFDQLVIRAGFNDQGPPEPFIRDETIRRLSHDMGQVAAHGTVATVFTNGGYAGYYNPTERVHEEFMQSYLGGGSEWDVISPSFASSAEGPGIVDGDRLDFANLMTNVWTGSAVRQVTSQAAYLNVARRLDVVNFADYCLLNSYVAMGDWPANNWRAGRERATNALWRFIAWDAEWGMGIYGLVVTRDSFAFSGSGTEDAGLNSVGNSEIARLYQGLRANREFRLLWADRIQKHFFNGGALTGGNISNRFNELRAQLSLLIPAMQTEILDWARDRHNIIMGQFNTYGLYGFSNALYGIFASSNAPAFNQHGGRVSPGFALTMTAPLPGSVIYFTTNGSDPRVPFTGAVSNSAVQYTGPVTLSQSTVIRARALWNGTNWSALNEAEFNIASLGIPLRLTELMYNPTNPTHEFLEIQNVGATPVDLNGMTFDGINFTFTEGSVLAPGARLVLASDLNPAAFAARYPGVTVFGYYGGGLNNGGERIALLDTAGNIVFSVDYDDANGWPTDADGGGSSLEVINPNGDPDDPTNWRAGLEAGGTPGAGPTVFPVHQVKLNEVFADNVSAVNNGGTFPDFVELVNNGAAISVAGWSLTDDGNTRKFVFPPGTFIPAGGHLVVWCDAATNTTPGLHSGFALERNGDTVFLYDAFTNRVDAIGFGVQAADFSIGRVVSSWVLNTPTPNAANTAAALGSASTVSINEFLANPPSGESDWLELFNNSALPVALRGTFLATTTAVQQVTSLSFIAPFGFAQFFADENVGPDHLDLRLPATGGAIIFYDTAATEIDRLTYAAQTEGVSRGRLPDGSANVVNFPGTASPGSSNYAASYSGPALNEVLARNVSAVTNNGRVADFVELYNPNGTPSSLAGMSLSVNSAEPGQWHFPPDAIVPANGYVVVWCDGGLPISTNTGSYNVGQALDGESGGVYLFNPAGQLVNSQEYGFQVADRSIGLVGPVPPSSGWFLLASPTPGAPNTGQATLGPAAALRINEWMAQSPDGPDWFELFNPTNLPVDMTRLVLTDDPTTSGTNEFRVPPLSFIGPTSFVQWIADSAPEQGRNHVSFDLDSQGESIRLYATNGSTIIDSVAFGLQPIGVSQGRIPDGFTNSVSFPGSPTPNEPNYRLINGVVINEVLTHATTALGQLIELHNPSSQPTSIGGWFLSDNASVPKKFRIPDGRTIPANGFVTFQQSEFGTGANAFSLDRARGGELWLSEADAAGNLSGFRTGVKFGAAANNISFGRYGNDFVAQSARTFGAANAGPLVGPIVLNEFMYHPLETVAGATEFIEVRNTSGASVDLFDPARPANTWRLSGGIEYTFPQGTSLAAGSHLLVVDFDPVANPSALATFRTIYGVSGGVTVLGPYAGKLDNAGETIELLKPDLPDGTFVPYVLVEKIGYRDAAPWPSGGADGGGFSLQRRTGTAYANDPANWLAAAPTAGGANAAGGATPPQIVQSPVSTNALINTELLLQAVAAGSGPLFWQWRFNGVELPGETNSALYIDRLRLGDSGSYDTYALNPGGPAFSAAAQVLVVEPPMIFAAPPNYITTNGGSNITFTVAAGGTPPLRYQWKFEGADLPGATAASLSLTNVAIEQSGVYTLSVSNDYGIASTNLTFVALVRPAFVVQPQPVTVLQGGTAVFTALAAPSHPLAPLYYRWIRNGVGVQTSTVPVIVFNNVQMGLPNPVPIRCAVTNFTTGVGGINSLTVNMTVLADFDQDGMADSWEVQYGFNTNSTADAILDLDGDGMINRDEYGAGTNPLDPQSLLKLVLTTTNAAVLEFVAQNNLSYAVQYRTNLASASWNNWTSISAQSSMRTVQVNVPKPPVERERYYRIVTPPPIAP